MVPPRLCYGLNTLVEPDHVLLQGVSLGFTLCGRYLISYEADVASAHHIQYFLLLWDFDSPHNIRLFARYRLFASTTMPGLSENLTPLATIFQHSISITICQMASPPCLIVHGFFKQLLAEQTRSNFISIIPVSSNSQCLHFSMQSYFPHFSLDQNSAAAVRVDISDRAMFQLIFDCSIAVRWVLVSIDAIESAAATQDSQQRSPTTKHDAKSSGFARYLDSNPSSSSGRESPKVIAQE
uniref:DDB1- and CUL4-associated factor 15 WD40 repeat-containing domain-containing protein n=1 Tax=Spongospora subterranea TaxID=70186 RepID=A0A0H5QIK2_9EUKA|eukprot:CRZ01813.1 hypothetical protein [Spongospora subterranea]